MSLRIPSERASEAMFVLQTARNLFVMIAMAVIVATLVNADPGHVHVLALSTILRDWVHAAFTL